MGLTLKPRKKQGLQVIAVAVGCDYEKIQKVFKKAYVLSDNLAVLTLNSNKDVEDFREFKGPLTLTHIHTGGKVGTVQGHKKTLIKLAEDLEQMIDFNHDDVDVFRNIPKETVRAIVSRILRH